MQSRSRARCPGSRAVSVGYALDALIVFAVCVVGSFLVWVIANVLAVWKRRRDEDAEFQRSLVTGGLETGEKAGVHATETVTVGQLMEREATSETTMGLRFVGRGQPQ